MKRLTINDIAKASLRTGKRAYLSLAIGIFLSIFLVTSLFMTVNGISLAKWEQTHQKVGYQDMIIFNAAHYPSEIMESGLHERIGAVSVTALITDSEWFMGYYDETAEELFARRFIEGGMPERPGEIALEQHVLDYLRSDAKVGESIALNLTPIDGADEEKTFTISGILVNQSEMTSGEHYTRYDSNHTFMPAMLVHPDDALSSGRTVRHYLLTMKKGVDRRDAIIYWDERGEETAYHDSYGNLIIGAYELPNSFTDFWNEITVSLYIVAIALITACCVGISQALESILTRRVDQIGMLRAVGATKRQIRRIFGREAWMLALILSPVSVAAGCAFGWVMSLLLPGAVQFGMDFSMILPILLLSAVFILIAAGLPLRRASQILPMGVIRDTAMLRKVKGVKSRKVFDAPILIAGRQIRLHWSRQVGAALMVMMMLVVIGVAGGFAGQDMGSYWDEQGDYQVQFESPSNDSFVDVVPPSYVNQADLQQMLALEHVEKIKAVRSLYINLNVEGEVPEYLKQHLVNSSNDHLLEELFDENSSGKKEGVAEHEAALSAFGKNGTLAQLRLMVLTEEDIELLQGNVTEGKIDMDALNEGREVLAFAPDIYRRLVVDEHWNESYYTYRIEDERTTAEECYEFFLANDAFTTGQTLPMLYAWVAKSYDQLIAGGTWTTEKYGELDTVEVSPSVGAVLGGGEIGGNLWMIYMPCLITTERGARAMGIPLLSIEQMDIFLDGEVDRETEDYLTSRINGICQRGGIMNFFNNMEYARSNRELQTQMLMAMIAAVIVFFAVSFSMISGNVKRRIRADERMIGTLRAVGADRRTVVKCYLLQTLLTILLGFLLAAAACITMVVMGAPVSVDKCFVIGAVMLGFAAACFGLCTLTVQRAVGEVMKRSVVENIREL